MHVMVNANDNAAQRTTHPPRQDIREALKARGSSLYQVARHFGVSLTCVCSAADNPRQSAGRKYKRRIAQILGKPIAALWPEQPSGNGASAEVH